MRILSLAAISLFTVTACQSGTDAPASQTSEAAVEAAPEASGAAAAEVPSEPAPAEEAVPTPAEVDAPTPAGLAADAPVTLAPTLCTYVGGDFIQTDEGNGTIGGVAYANGHLFVAIGSRIGEERVNYVQRWDVSLDGGCTLTLDADFAGDGMLEYGGSWGVAANDDYLMVVANTTADGVSSRLFDHDGQPSNPPCSPGLSGYNTVRPDGTFSVGVNDQTSVVIDGCGRGEPAYAAGHRLWDPVFLGEDVIARRSGGGEDPAIERVQADGTVVWAATTAGEGDDARPLDFVSTIGVVGERVFVARSSRPHHISILSGQGTLLGDWTPDRDSLADWPTMTTKGIAAIDDTRFLGVGSAFTSNGLRRGVVLFEVIAAE